jgi:hypothetical protein
VGGGYTSIAIETGGLEASVSWSLESKCLSTLRNEAVPAERWAGEK